MGGHKNDTDVVQGLTKPRQSRSPLNPFTVGLITILLVSVGIFFLLSRQAETQKKKSAGSVSKTAGIFDGHFITLPANSASLTEIKTIRIELKEPLAERSFSGVVEANQQKLQQITPLISGRVEVVNAALGDSIKKGEVLVIISSPQVAELHGKLHEAETRLQLAKENLERVQGAANRAGILKAQASLEQAEATLKRLKQLNVEGLAASKDVLAAETERKRADAEFEFQQNIPLNREVTESKAQVQLAEAEVNHIRDALAALGVDRHAGISNNEHDISLVRLRSPITGSVIERYINAGAGVEPAKPLLTIADVSNLWVIANIPEAQTSELHLGSAARVQPLATDQAPIYGKVTYIDPRLNEETRSLRVRVEVPNNSNKLKVGMFVQVFFDTKPVSAVSDTQSGRQILIPDEAVQKIDDQDMVFVSAGKGRFEVRKVSLGRRFEEKILITDGLRPGEQIVTAGSFILKSAMLKSQFGGDD